MALFPEVQRKAQAELDQVVGPQRLPEFADIQNMPYIRAVIMESLRWMPVTPFGVPHVVMADDTYKGYHIPKGAVMVPVSAFIQPLLKLVLMCFQGCMVSPRILLSTGDPRICAGV